MQMMTRTKLIPTTLMVLLAVVALGGLLPVTPGHHLLSPGVEVWAATGARGGAGTSAGAGGGAVGAGAGAPSRGAAGTPTSAPRGYVR